MKRVLTIFFVILICIAGVYAQGNGDPVIVDDSGTPAAASSSGSGGGMETFFGLKVNLGFANIREISDTYGDSYSYDPLFTGGFGLRFAGYKGVIGFIAELEWVRMGAKERIFGNTFTDKLKLDYVYLNAMFSVKFSAFYMGFGFSVGYLLKAQAVREYDSGTTLSDDVKDSFKSADVAFITSIGALFNVSRIKLFVGLDFRISLMKINEYASSYSKRNYSVLLNLGLGI